MFVGRGRSGIPVVEAMARPGTRTLHCGKQSLNVDDFQAEHGVNFYLSYPSVSIPPRDAAVLPELVPHNTRYTSSIPFGAALRDNPLPPHLRDQPVLGELHHSTTLENFHSFTQIGTSATMPLKLLSSICTS